MQECAPMRLLRLTLACCGVLWPLLASATPPVDAAYPTPRARASIRRDDVFKRIGQYLFLEEPEGKGDRVVSAVLDIPEHWRVQSVRVSKEGVTLTCEGGARYRLTRRNVGPLSFAILDGA